MKLFEYKGIRIQYSDKNLLLNFALTRLTAIFLLVMLLFYGKALVNYDWSGLSLLRSGDAFNDFDFSYLAMAVVVALILCGVSAVLYCLFSKDNIKQVRQRQALARMIIENKWYETESEKTGSIFKDWKPSTKERISYFPKVYYRMKNNRIYISAEITMGRFQEQLMTMEKKIEGGLFCELIDKVANEPYIEYVFYYDLAKTRLTIDEVNVRKGKMELMKDFYWSFDSMPHMLITGGTGSGKSYFILTLIKSLLEAKANIFVLDPKNTDLAYLENVMPDVYYKPEDIIFCVESFCAGMLERNEIMKTMPNYKMGGNYASLCLNPHFLIFDEYVAFFEMLDRKQSEEVLTKLKQIAMLGRQSGYFIVLACQRPDAKYLADGIRDQFHFRLALGRNSELGYKMMFGDTTRVFTTSKVKGRGYVDSGTNVISEFYSPFVPEGYDFLEVVKQAAKNNENLENSWESTTPEIMESEDINCE